MLQIACHVEVEEVVDIAECAGKAILAIYNSQVWTQRVARAADA